MNADPNADRKPWFSGLVQAALLAGGVVSSPALASGGGESSKNADCIWAQDLSVSVRGHQLTVPADAVKAGKILEQDGFSLHPDPRSLFLVVRAPDGETWRAGLTQLQVKSGKKTCIAYYAGHLQASGSLH